MAEDTKSYKITPFTSISDATAHWHPLLLELGWNRSKHDVPGHFAATLTGSTWLNITPSNSSEPAGSVMACIYPNRTGWVGCFIMNAAYRGKGLGAALWREMQRTYAQHQVSIIGLDAVPEQVNTYARRGFVSCGKIPLMTRKSLDDQPLSEEANGLGETGIKRLADVDPKELARVDMEHTGLDRTAYWVASALPQRSDSLGFAIVEDAKVTGFIYVRKVQNGHRFGPLHAQADQDAKKLLRKAMQGVSKSEAYHVEVFDGNQGAVRAFEELGWEHIGLSYKRMWLDGRVPEEQMEGGQGQKGMWAIFDAASG